uniref:FBD domain-containing protein n=1 Tax=Hordeum vulgare subsp. vulgare TaxID=112509 RepID=A0A8I6WQ70_HORVV
MIAVGLPTKMHSVRVLLLDYTNLDIVVNFLKCFPCLERLYVFFPSRLPMSSNPQEYHLPEPIECLDLHLKEVLLKNYDSIIPLCIHLAKFFVLNAKVLKEMKITLPYHRQYDWFANQRRLLRTDDRISQDAQIELRCGTNVHFRDNRNTHDLSMADPFDVPSSRCEKCSGSPF